MSVDDTLLVVDDTYLPVLLQALSHAKKTVDILAFSFAASRTAHQKSVNAAEEIIEKLIALKEKRGVKFRIRLYIEGRRETAERNRLTAERLKKAGVKVKYGSTHAKGFCIDGRYILFGSTNLTNQSILKNNETNIFIDNTETAEGFTAYFDHLWQGGKHGGIHLDPPLLADGEFEPALIQLIANARKTLEFSIYFFHYTAIEEALVDAHQRGVKVTGFIHHHNSFALSFVKRTRGTANRLIAAGIKDLHFGPGHLFTHSKYIIRDRQELLLGTGNWLHQDVDVHPQLYIQITNAPIAKQLSAHLKKQIRNLQH